MGRVRLFAAAVLVASGSCSGTPATDPDPDPAIRAEGTAQSVKPDPSPAKEDKPARHRGLPWARTAPDVEYDKKSGLPKEVIDKGTGIELVLIPAGTFMFGASPDDPEASIWVWNDGDEIYPQRKVTIAKPFYLGKYEVMQSECELGKNRYDATGLNHPVDNLSWREIQPWLKERGFRLPTDEEWEYACRAGTTGPTYGPLLDIAVILQGYPSRVATKTPNAFGLYDMIGNVWEWCATPTRLVEERGAQRYARMEPPPRTGKKVYLRIMRGGGAGNLRTYWLRASVRPAQEPGYEGPGFRVARDP